MNSIEKNVIAIKKLIAEYEKKYQREPNSVALIAATKHQSIEKISAAIEAGQYSFGENYLQEALLKMQALVNFQLEWHFIGPIQSNKTRKIAEHFAWVQCVDNEKIAERLNAQRPLQLPPLNICIEVNVSAESSKSGVNPENVLSLAQFCQQLPRLRLRGLMAIPAPQPDFASQRREFKKLSAIYHSLREQGFELDTLSMGMSDDFEAAIAEGATIVRVGTAIFGARAFSK